MKMQISGYPMERIATDILDELPKTNDGNKYILVILDILWIFWYNSMIQEEFLWHFDDRIPILNP